MLAYLGTRHDVPAPSDVETAKNLRVPPLSSTAPASAPDSTKQRFADVVAQAKPSAGAAPTVAFGDASAIVVPDLAGQTVRNVTEQCSRLGLAPLLIGSGVAVEQYPEGGAQVVRGSRVTVRFGRPGEVVPVSARGNGN